MSSSNQFTLVSFRVHANSTGRRAGGSGGREMRTPSSGSWVQLRSPSSPSIVICRRQRWRGALGYSRMSRLCPRYGGGGKLCWDRTARIGWWDIHVEGTWEGRSKSLPLASHGEETGMWRFGLLLCTVRLNTGPTRLPQG